ncbi:MAG: hypothetical protein AAFO95_20795 [Cyanobacteria bacterium J06600_6]
MAAVKGNQPKLYQAIQEEFIAHDRYHNICKGHGRIEKRQVSTAYLDLNLSLWSSVKTIIKVELKAIEYNLDKGKSKKIKSYLSCR